MRKKAKWIRTIRMRTAALDLLDRLKELSTMVPLLLLEKMKH